MSYSNFEDIEAIKILRSRYFRSMDMGDYDTFRSLLAEDLVTDLKGSNYHFHFDNRDDFVEAVANALNANSAAHHVAHHPEITLTSPTTAEGIWYLQDWALDVPSRTVCSGTAIIKDKYQKIDGQWKIVHYQYRRILELTSELPETTRLTAHYLGEHGRTPLGREL
jgi:ketosteroid isomerase-like protein